MGLRCSRYSREQQTELILQSTILTNFKELVNTGNFGIQTWTKVNCGMQATQAANEVSSGRQPAVMISYNTGRGLLLDELRAEENMIEV